MMGSREFYGDIFAELGRLQQGVEQALRPAASQNIRAVQRRTFPLINVGSTADALEVLALTPGIEPSTLQITVDKGLLVIAGERNDDELEAKQGAAVYAKERFRGSFRRVVSLPEDADPARIDATCRDGMLRIKIGRREEAKPRKVTVN